MARCFKPTHGTTLTLEVPVPFSHRTLTVTAEFEESDPGSGTRGGWWPTSFAMERNGRTRTFHLKEHTQLWCRMMDRFDALAADVDGYDR